MPFSKESAFDRLQEAHRAGRLAHAYLLSGPVGCGKSWLAGQLAALVLGCEADRVVTHPDAHIVQPESKSRRIVIDQIRDLEHAMQRKPLLGSSKVAIIQDAERLQPQAANAFLKTLEEPPPGSLILLLSSLPEAMLETVLSRCVETALQRHGAAEATPEEAAVLRALDECLAKPENPGVAEAFRFVRAIQNLLGEARERISGEYEGLLRDETARYKQASEGSSWLEERADQIKALTEAAALRERERILQMVLDVLAEALRSQHGVPSGRAVVGALASRFSAPSLLRKVDTLETIRKRLAMGVQEALALETGFLELIARQETRSGR